MPERGGRSARGTEKRAQKRVSSIQPDTAEGTRSTGTGTPRPHLKPILGSGPGWEPRRGGGELTDTEQGGGREGEGGPP